MPARESKRSAQRLLKLVNTLLEYACVEGGRAQARFMSPDLSVITGELSSSLRSARED